MGNNGKRYTEEFKADIIRLIREEKRSISSLEKDFGFKDRDRDRDIVTPFLNARRYILLAQESNNEEYRIEQLNKANDELTKSINAVYTKKYITISI